MKLTDLWHKVRMKRTHTNTSTRIDPEFTLSSFHLFHSLTYVGRVTMWKARWAVVSLLVIQIRELTLHSTSQPSFTVPCKGISSCAYRTFCYRWFLLAFCTSLLHDDRPTWSPVEDQAASRTYRYHITSQQPQQL